VTALAVFAIACAQFAVFQLRAALEAAYTAETAVRQRAGSRLLGWHTTMFYLCATAPAHFAYFVRFLSSFSSEQHGSPLS
jgi:hypothetical protein